MATHYDLLGVASGASADEIKKAYLKLARERHPDRFTDPAERERADAFFKQLTSAYNTLSNPSSRREYDESLAKPKITVPEEIARDAFERGSQKFKNREFHDAIDLLRVSVRHEPGNPRYRAALGRALAQNPNWIRDAIRELEESARLAPKVASTHAEIARLYQQQGLGLRARRAVELARKLAPDDEAIAALEKQLEGGDAASGREAPEAAPKKGLRGLFGKRS